MYKNFRYIDHAMGAAKTLRTRLIAAAGAIVISLAGLGVYVAGGAFADEIGDALYAALSYAVAAVLLPRWRPIAVALVAAAWC